MADDPRTAQDNAGQDNPAGRPDGILGPTVGSIGTSGILGSGGGIDTIPGGSRPEDGVRPTDASPGAAADVDSAKADVTKPMGTDRAGVPKP